jgi:hypothetical protein
VRAVLDPNILISALLSPRGSPAEIVARWLRGELEVVVSERLLDELERALAHPNLRAHVTEDEASGFVSLLRRAALFASDPPSGAHHSMDPADDYLLALAEADRAVIVSGDRHLLELSDLPIQSARAFLDRLPD